MKRHPSWLNHHPQDWQPGTLDRDALHASADALVADPRFAQTRIEFIEQWLWSFDAHPVTQRVVRDTPLYLLLVFALFLHHRRDPVRSSSGITLTALRGLYAHGTSQRVFASPSRVRDMLQRAEHAGLLEPARATPGRSIDRRVRRLEPTPLAWQIFGRWIVAFLRGSARMLRPPVPVDEHTVLDEQAVGAVFCHRIAAYLHDRFVLTERCAPVQEFMLRDHGYLVFLRLMHTVRAEGGRYVARAPVGELAERFEVARATVRNVLAQAQAAGQLEYERGGLRVVLSPAFHAVAQRWLALEMVWMHGLACCALEPNQRPETSSGRIGR
jgi:hypothetical protein